MHLMEVVEEVGVFLVVEVEFVDMDVEVVVVVAAAAAVVVVDNMLDRSRHNTEMGLVIDSIVGIVGIVQQCIRTWLSNQSNRNSPMLLLLLLVVGLDNTQQAQLVVGLAPSQSPGLQLLALKAPVKALFLLFDIFLFSYLGLY
jgi:hypothetical protein